MLSGPNQIGPLTRTKMMYMLQVKIKFRLKFFILGSGLSLRGGGWGSPPATIKIKEKWNQRNP